MPRDSAEGLPAVSIIFLIETSSRARIDSAKGCRLISSIDSRRRLNATEAKAIVALAFRNGPIEDIHAGERCPTCSGRKGFSRITAEEIHAITKGAVDRVYRLLVFRDENPDEYARQIVFGERYTTNWDKPKMPRVLRRPER